MRPKKMFLYRGEYRSYAELRAMTGVSETTIWSRLRKGWTIEEAVETPLQVSHRHPHKQKACCDDWGNDCFRCPLPECNDNRAPRDNERIWIPETVGVRDHKGKGDYEYEQI